MLVLKFGGTSVGFPEAVARLADIIKDKDHAGRVRAVVVSAFSGVTDALIAAAGQAAVSGDGSAVFTETGFRPVIETLRKRHLDTAAFFLKGPALAEAEEEIEGTLKELLRILDGVAMLKELSPRILDQIMSFGARLAAPLVARVCSAAGTEAEYFDAREAVKTDDRYGAARFLPGESYALIRALMEKRPKLQVVTGFIGSTLEGFTTTLGRGGSDTSAAIFGAALGAERVEIWTDVEGILTADPKMVKNAFRIESISYNEAMELSHFGAKVLHPPTVRPALEKGIPILIKNTFNPSGGGTLINNDADPGSYPIRGISSLNNVTLIRVQGSGMVGVAGFSSRLFGALARKRISVIMISQASSEYSICFAVEPSAGSPAAAAIREEFDREIAAGAIEAPIPEPDLAVIAVVGSRMKNTSGISGKVFHALGRNGINVIAIAQGSSEINISAVIARQDEAKALNAVHEAFFLSGVRSVNLFLLGTGLIGGTLVEQLAGHREVLADEHKIRINLVGIANSRKMLFDGGGLDPKNIGSKLEEGEDLSLSRFIEKMKALNLPNTAFCDCTASDEVAASYGDVLKSAVPIITPNKRANASSYEYYKTLTAFSKDRGIPYLYETTVCAGLPVISTLRDLFLSGDRVQRIEAVLSGTLSYIFNNFDGSKPFSVLVREARAKGYTEPDPRDDLNAMDAARKALILARECGMALEFSAVQVEPLLPPACFEAADVESFFTELEKIDALFEKRRAAAAAAGRALRYVAVIEEAPGSAAGETAAAVNAGGSVRLSLREEPPESSFRSLVDSDNIVVITTDRYSTLPLVVKGPGAGAQVTAGGVFADIVRIARTLV